MVPPTVGGAATFFSLKQPCTDVLGGVNSQVILQSCQADHSHEHHPSLQIKSFKINTPISLIWMLLLLVLFHNWKITTERLTTALTQVTQPVPVIIRNKVRFKAVGFFKMHASGVTSLPFLAFQEYIGEWCSTPTPPASNLPAHIVYIFNIHWRYFSVKFFFLCVSFAFGIRII